jgi:hypothetical protein
MGRYEQDWHPVCHLLVAAWGRMCGYWASTGAMCAGWSPVLHTVLICGCTGPFSCRHILVIWHTTFRGDIDTRPVLAGVHGAHDIGPRRQRRGAERPNDGRRGFRGASHVDGHPDQGPAVSPHGFSDY